MELRCGEDKGSFVCSLLGSVGSLSQLFCIKLERLLERETNALNILKLKCSPTARQRHESVCVCMRVLASRLLPELSSQ